MALTIPASDLQGTLLNNNVTNITNLVAANPLMAPSLNAALLDAQLKLAIYLLSNNYISPATVLAGSGATFVGSAHTFG